MRGGLVTLTLLCAALVHAADVPGVREAKEPLDLFQARLRYGLAVRNGSQVESMANRTINYGGVTPNDLALAAWGWFLLERHLGLTASYQREGFALFSNGARVTGGGLSRLHLAPTGRIDFGPIKLEAAAGYALHEVPAFSGVGDSVALAAQARHALFLGARAQGELGPVTLEARFEYPLSFAAAPGGYAFSGFTLGGGLRAQLFRTGSLKWGAMFEAVWVTDRAVNGSLGVTASQSVVRLGLALDVKWQEEAVAAVEVPVVVPVVEPVVEPVAPRFGALELRVSSKETKQPIKGAKIVLGDQTLTTDAQGVARADELPGGVVALKISAKGYLPAEEASSIAPGQTSKVSVALQPEQKRELAQVTGHVRSIKDGRPVAAELSIPQAKLSLKADASGSFSFSLPAGTYAVSISAKGFLTQNKSVTVKDGDQVIFNVDLFPR